MCIVQQFPQARRSRHAHKQYGHHALECQLSQPQKWQRGGGERKENQGLCESVLKNNVFFKPGNRSRQQQKPLLPAEPNMMVKGEENRNAKGAGPPARLPTPTAPLRLICPSAVLLFSLCLPSPSLCSKG